MRGWGWTSAVVAACLATAMNANAATITLDQCTIAELCGQVTVTTTLVANTIDVDVVDVAGAPASGLFGQSGANRAFGFNLIDPDLGVVISNLTAGFAYAGADVHGMGGGWGDYEFVIDGPKTGSSAILPLHFNISRDAGFSSDIVFGVNDAGFAVVAHVRNNDNGVTGFVAGLASTPEEDPQDPQDPEDPQDPQDPEDSRDQPSDEDASVPEPAALVLFGIGLATVARRMRSAKPTSTTPVVNQKP